MRNLRDLDHPGPTQKIILEEYLQIIEARMEQVSRLEVRMLLVLEDWEWNPVVKALMAFKGFKEVAAMITISELGDLTRFQHPRQLMAFLGLVPSENSTGTKRRQGAITKCGNAHARWILIQSAQAYGKPGQSLGPTQQTPGRTTSGSEESMLASPESTLRVLPSSQGPRNAGEQGHRSSGAGTLCLPLGTSPTPPRSSAGLHSGSSLTLSATTGNLSFCPPLRGALEGPGQ